MNTLQVQTGMSSKEMEKYNGIMKEMYNKNYGDSFDDIAQSIATVAQNSKEVDPAKIQELTEGAPVSYTHLSGRATKKRRGKRR